jgi:hypothetical protein
MLGKIIISILITTLVSILAGLIVPGNFWIVFVFAFVLQVLFFYFFNSIYENRLIEKAQQIRLEELKEINKQIVTVQCPCDEKVRQDIQMRFDRDVIYQCNKCKKNIKAISDVKTLLTTEPIYFND